MVKPNMIKKVIPKMPLNIARCQNIKPSMEELISEDNSQGQHGAQNIQIINEWLNKYNCYKTAHLYNSIEDCGGPSPEDGAPDDFNELKRVSNCVHQSQENKYKSIIDGINQSEGIITNLQGNNTTHFQGNNTGMRMIVERFQNKDNSDILIYILIICILIYIFCKR